MAGRSEMGQLKPVKCTYGHCSMRFDTEREMKYHKKNDPEHFYCKRCNVDCVDFEDLTQHKVDMMRPWLEKQTRPAGESPQHIVCEFCGKDFKSFGGRKLHREQVSLKVRKLRGCICSHTIGASRGPEPHVSG